MKITINGNNFIVKTNINDLAPGTIMQCVPVCLNDFERMKDTPSSVKMLGILEHNKRFSSVKDVVLIGIAHNYEKGKTEMFFTFDSIINSREDA